MTKLVTIFGAIFTVAGMFNLWGIVLSPAGFNMATIGLVDIISMWSGLALLCIAAAMVLRNRRQAYYNSDD